MNNHTQSHGQSHGQTPTHLDRLIWTGTIIFAKVLEFGGGILVGGIILIVGNFLSSIAHKKLSANGNAGLANIARVAIPGLALAMGLRSMGLDNIVNMAIGFTIGAVAVATTLAFGCGGRDVAKTIADRWAQKTSHDQNLNRAKVHS